MEDSECTISLRGLSTGYRLKGRDKTIGAGLTAQLHAGELTCMLGPNGAGKSTLLRTLAAFQPPLGGDVGVMGRGIGSYSHKELSRVVSVVLTDNSGIRNLTVEEVVAIGRSPYTGFWGRLREKDHKAVDKCLQWVGIADLKGRRMQSLSDGERQKTMIAKAIAQETPIILLDEPTAYLDYPSKVAMMLLLHRLAKALRKTIFLSTHDLEHALQVADRVWLIDQRMGLCTGIPEDLCAEGRIEAYFRRDGLLFDREACSFSIAHEAAREVLFEGNPGTLAYKLAARAFTRNAMRPIRSMDEARFDSTTADVRVAVGDDGTLRLYNKGVEAAHERRIEPILAITNSTIVKNQIRAVRDAAQLPDESA